SWTSAHAGRDAVERRQMLVVDAVDAQRAFLHYPLAVVVLARTVRAGPGAQLAADAGVGIDEHDAALRALVGCTRRTHGDASRRLAVQARAREVHGPARGAFAGLVGMDAVQPRAVRVFAVRILIGQGSGIAGRVPLLAARRTGMAADAGVEVDHQPEFFSGA